MKWAQIAGFFSQLQTSPRLDEDGFVRLEPTESNRHILEASMPKNPVSSTLGAQGLTQRQ